MDSLLPIYFEVKQNTTEYEVSYLRKESSFEMESKVIVLIDYLLNYKCHSFKCNDIRND